MSQLSPSLQRHYQNQQNEFDAKKFHRLQQSSLYNEQTFYRTFLNDLQNAKREVIIYCPFVSKYRSEYFRKALKELQRRNVAVFIFTRPIEEHENVMKNEVTSALKDYENLGVILHHPAGFIHQKVAIIDREILWEGSLNILSQRKSREMMRRFHEATMTMNVLDHLGIRRLIAESYKLKYERLYRSLVDGAADQKRKARMIGIGLGLGVLAVWSLWMTIGTMIPIADRAAMVMRLLTMPLN